MNLQFLILLGIVFVCMTVVIAVNEVEIMTLHKENAALIEKLDAKSSIAVDIDVRGRYVFATAQSGNATVETRRLLSDWGIYRKLEIE